MLTQLCAWALEVQGGYNWRTVNACNGDNRYAVTIIDIFDKLLVDAALDPRSVLPVEMK